jgi:hypothetical protein
MLPVAELLNVAKLATNLQRLRSEKSARKWGLKTE